jgi:hypothetical protein
MSGWLRRMFTPFQSSPRRWFWVMMLVLTLFVLWLTGNLR